MQQKYKKSKLNLQKINVKEKQGARLESFEVADDIIELLMDNCKAVMDEEQALKNYKKNVSKPVINKTLKSLRGS